jgi:hypothetical protein
MGERGEIGPQGEAGVHGPKGEQGERVSIWWQRHSSPHRTNKATFSFIYYVFFYIKSRFFC